VRSHSGRRPVLPLLFLLVLAAGTVVVWMSVFAQDRAQSKDAAAACATASAAPRSLDPSAFTVRVLNSTGTAGLAQQVATNLRDKGFSVGEVGNDGSGRQVTGAGEVRHGPRGNDAAVYLRQYVKGVTDYPDTRADGTVDLVLGPDFQFPGNLLTAEELSAAAESQAAAAATCAANG
jgi:hypothetical protein